MQHNETGINKYIENKRFMSQNDLPRVWGAGMPRARTLVLHHRTMRQGHSLTAGTTRMWHCPQQFLQSHIHVVSKMKLSCFPVHSQHLLNWSQAFHGLFWTSVLCLSLFHQHGLHGARVRPRIRSTCNNLPMSDMLPWYAMVNYPICWWKFRINWIGWNSFATWPTKAAYSTCLFVWCVCIVYVYMYIYTYVCMYGWMHVCLCLYA